MQLPKANSKILQSAIKAAKGNLKGTNMPPGLCLKLVRLVVEDALFNGTYSLYQHHLTAGTSYRKGTPEQRLTAAKRDPWASDFEASMKQQSLTIPATDRTAGDLVFDHTAAYPMGHVGVLLGPDWVLENANPKDRPYSIPTPVPNLLITPYQFPRENSRWTLVARLPSPVFDLTLNK